ncbi:phytanoyl-CoA dioxygenase family protein [Nocardioides bruguierae]|uniref:Phytanoyl-CoA dioxygenase family protein n=1 Tax=Nocardioides bruguierae TaxID=2945102 RepID=A0A9X2ID57_9ACTN|nr:phytanoyl-CoA dioxygenase family protein [Nocardioides bruguierae]MCM0618683.1 phytanoyl-CoA dioxygenase family protein [Nocardioides bruguierae]
MPSLTSSTAASARTATGWLSADDCSLEDFKAVVEQTTELADYPFADAVASNVLLYGEKLRAAMAGPQRREVQAELMRALTDGPGIVVLQGAFDDHGVVDRATDAFLARIELEKAAGTAAGDHFAKPGANDRVWGALDKLAVAEPEVFADYYANDALALISEAWLGPGYQVTSQVNVVNPGGQAQRAHRDYHLGFMDAATSVQFPAHAHLLSPALTLQGAVAHCDMPVETGPTLYLPYSHQYEPGYLAFHLQEFTDYFLANYVQLPLAKGDAAFFNPALFHGAGTNVSADVRRMANLLQVSSPFGRAMESVDRVAMCKALYPVLLQRQADGADQADLDNVIASSAEGYSFPTNLDRDQPVGLIAPQTQAGLMRQALAEKWSVEELEQALDAQAERTRPGLA